MSNTFSYGKCWNFGKMLKSHVGDKTFAEVVKTQDWINLKKNRQLTDNQIYYIRRGFLGKPFEDTTERDKPNSDTLDDELFPFGVHKGKKYSEVPDRYIEWLADQPWLDKWGNLVIYTKRRLEKMNEGKATKEEIEEFMKFKLS
jgi:uncharacterized protein (DUF3820 family)